MRTKAALILSAATALFLASCGSMIRTRESCKPSGDPLSIVIHAPDPENVHVLPDTALVCNKKQDILWASVSGELTEITFKANSVNPPPDPVCLKTGRKNKCELKKDKLKVGTFYYSVRGTAENGEPFDKDPVVIIIP